jgi:hypothetical protein
MDGSGGDCTDFPTTFKVFRYEFQDNSIAKITDFSSFDLDEFAYSIIMFRTYAHLYVQVDVPFTHANLAMYGKFHIFKNEMLSSTAVPLSLKH